MIVAAFILLALSTLSIFLHRKWWFWAPLIVAAIVCAYLSNMMMLWGLIPILVAWGSYFALSSPIAGWKRAIMALIATFVSSMLFFHYFPGFTPQFLVPKLGAFNFDKPFAGFFILVFLLKIAKTRQGFFRAYVRSIPFIVGSLLVLLGVAYATNYVHYSPKLPANFWLWAFRNMFLVCIPEEAFFRGFLQREIRRAMPKKMGVASSVILASLCFVVIHLNISVDPTYLSMIFIAGILFGLVYYLTDSIESAILTHFFTNLLHYTVFVS